MTTVTLVFILKKAQELLYLPNWPADNCGVPGLVVCPKPVGTESDDDKPVYWSSNGAYKFTPDRLTRGYNWQIVHQKSGIGVFQDYLSKDQAIEIAKNIAGVDWTVEASEVRANPAYGEMVRKTVGERYFREVER